MSALPQGRRNLSIGQRAALNAANSPSSYNAIATMDDIIAIMVANNTLSSEVTEWQDAQTDYIIDAGIPEADFVNNTPIGGGTVGAVGRTFINGNTQQRIRQHGYIRQVKVLINQAGSAAMRIKFKVFRYNTVTTNYDFIGESEEFEIGGTGVQTYTLTTPIACLPGDILGYHITGDATAENRAEVAYKSGGTYLYVAGDITDSNAFTSSVAYSANLLGSTYPPYLVVIGDSIARGANIGASDKWYSVYDETGISGNIEAQIQQRLRNIIGDGALLDYQNFALGSMGFEWVRIAIVDALKAKPNTVIIHCGVNDTGRDWVDVEDDLDAIKVSVDNASPVPDLYIDEILPSSNISDAASAKVREFNAEFATWCTANGATLIPCWEIFGQLRSSTGYNDDIIPTLSHDGTHLSLIGEDVLARIWLQYL